MDYGDFYWGFVYGLLLGSIPPYPAKNQGDDADFCGTDFRIQSSCRSNVSMCELGVGDLYLRSRPPFLRLRANIGLRRLRV